MGKNSEKQVLTGERPGPLSEKKFGDSVESFHQGRQKSNPGFLMTSAEKTIFEKKSISCELDEVLPGRLTEYFW